MATILTEMGHFNLLDFGENFDIFCVKQSPSGNFWQHHSDPDAELDFLSGGKCYLADTA
jgi:hypothetical protein